MKKTIAIKMSQDEHGNTAYCMVAGSYPYRADDNIEYPQEGKLHTNPDTLRRDAEAMYPPDSTWAGRAPEHGENGIWIIEA